MKRALDLFSGAGGLSLGLTMAGWDLKTAVEIDRAAMETHRINFPDAEHLCEDVRQIDFSRFAGKIDLVVGGPPCQPFSVSGKQLGHEDHRDLVPEFVRAVAEISPRAFMMENVHGLATDRFRTYLENQISKLKNLGYGVSWTVLNAADYGVPQRRKRLFIVGVRGASDFLFPPSTHGNSKQSYSTVRQALAGCPKDTPNIAKVVYAKNPVLRRSPYAGLLLNGKGRPLNLNAPSLTIPATAGGNRTHILDPNGVLRKYHQHLMAGGRARSGIVDDCRRLTVRESARLQTFPDSFAFAGRKSQQYSQIGNAVPPQFARAVLEALRTFLTGKKNGLPRKARV